MTRRGEVVLDVFLGSGTTLLAAERTGRVFVGTAIDPLYVDVAIERWMEATGLEAVEETSGRPFRRRETQALSKEAA